MATFQFEAMDSAGAEVKDTIEAASEEEAQAQIRKMGYFVTKLTEKTVKQKKAAKGKDKKKKKGKSFTVGGVKTKLLCTFTRQFSVLQDAGLPVLRSLKILEGQMKPGVLKNALMDVVDDIEAGSTLSEAFAKHPKCFDRLYVNMVKAGEASGNLDRVLERLADYLQRQQQIRNKVSAALAYPIVMLSVMIVIEHGVVLDVELPERALERYREHGR